MSQKQKKNTDREVFDALETVLTVIGRGLLGLGLLCTLLGGGYLYYVAIAAGNIDRGLEAQMVSNVELISKLFYAGLAGIGVGGSYLFWGEEFTGIIEVAIAAIFFFAPAYLGGLSNGTAPNAAVTAATDDLRNGGLGFGILALLVFAFDIAGRIYFRSTQGSSLDSLKLGKDVKEEKQVKTQLLGPCWTTIYCRKFVREKCPIFLAKKSCWRELVGCMCEEEVIAGALQNRAIPKDAILAAKYIPHNHKLTDSQKRDRCKSCVIYNEHQRQKYQVAMPGLVIGFIILYLILRQPLTPAVQAAIFHVQHMAGNLSLDQKDPTMNPEAADWLAQFLLAVGFFLLFSYITRLVEYMIFKLKL